MWGLPRVGNYIIQYQDGDGFRIHLPRMLAKPHFVITSRLFLDSYFSEQRNKCVTIHGLNKLTQKMGRKNTVDIPGSIILDIQIPRTGSKAFRNLKLICVGRSLILLHPPLLDLESINSLMTLLPTTKRKGIKLLKWSLFSYLRKH